MDTERLGRVLGVGARHAAKTFVGAVEAASAPSPAAHRRVPQQPPAGAAPATASVSERSVERPAAQMGREPARVVTVVQNASARTMETRRGVAEGGRRFGRAVWEPTVRLSGVLWLEVTGLFFGIFCVVAATAAWRLRGAIHAAPGVGNAQAHSQFLLAVGMLLVFGYFCGSSFFAANRRSRRR